jgi:hypothetical protein
MNGSMATLQCSWWQVKSPSLGVHLVAVAVWSEPFFRKAQFVRVHVRVRVRHVHGRVGEGAALVAYFKRIVAKAACSPASSPSHSN